MDSSEQNKYHLSYEGTKIKIPLPRDNQRMLFGGGWGREGYRTPKTAGSLNLIISWGFHIKLRITAN